VNLFAAGFCAAEALSATSPTMAVISAGIALFNIWVHLLLKEKI
jgi:hypothetical protein